MRTARLVGRRSYTAVTTTEYHRRRYIVTEDFIALRFHQRPTRRKIGHFEDALSSQNLLASIRLNCSLQDQFPRSIVVRHVRHARFPRDMLATSSRGCHEDATRKLLPWNLAYPEDVVISCIAQKSFAAGAAAVRRDLFAVVLVLIAWCGSARARATEIYKSA